MAFRGFCIWTLHIYCIYTNASKCDLLEEHVKMLLMGRRTCFNVVWFWPLHTLTLLSSSRWSGGSSYKCFYRHEQTDLWSLTVETHTDDTHSNAPLWYGDTRSHRLSFSFSHTNLRAHTRYYIRLLQSLSSCQTVQRLFTG